MHLNLLSIIIPLLLFLNEIIWSVATTNSPVLYHPLDNITVNCGSSGDSTAVDGRRWTGDIGSNYTPILHSNKGKLISSKATKPPLSPDPVPYMSARLSRWPFTYTFQVSPGQKFIRLNFYPASYQGGFERSKAFFTVKAGPYTLLSNFSASLAADALGLESLVKEYCVNVEENQPLILTLSPSLGGSSDEAYAFVNGIEIVSMPTGLYHTREGDAGAHVVGENFRFPVGKSIALEMVQRLNIGGSSISSIEDTGMFRDWSQDSYFFMQKSNVQPVTTTFRIKYSSIPSYTAPQKVYQTSWSMVTDKQGNGTLNFTWKFPIDLGFRYLLRLHFCDFEYEIEESDRTKFSIFVNEHVAEAKADIVKWSGGNRVAVYRDYVVMMEGDRKQGKDDLLIAYFPHNHEWAEHIDTILKGIEVFKMSNPDKNLAGVNPVPLLRASTSSNAKPRKFVYASGGNAIATVLVILLTITNISVYMLRVWGEKFNEKNISPLPPEGLCRRFSLSEVLSVTDNFNDEFVIGRGGFGNVYKALILKDQISPECLKVFTEVANKCLHKHPSGRPTMTDVVASLECMLASLEQPRNACTEEKEEEEKLDDEEDKEEDVNVHGDSDQQIYDDKNTQQNDILTQSTFASPSTPVQYNENTQCQNKSKKNLFQRGIAFLARSINIRSMKISDDELPSSTLRIFSFSELRYATRYFSSNRLLGEGRFGKVYRGRVDEKVTSYNVTGFDVAVKKLDYQRTQRFKDWQSVVGFLGGLSHSNLVKLLGYCWEGEELLLVYEFMPEGSLEKHLLGWGSPVLPWIIRVKILIGAARGLAFLHASKTPVICKDFQTSNILLDGSFNSKISDFGYADFDDTESFCGYVPTVWPGTVWPGIVQPGKYHHEYIAPEYFATGHLDVRSDVYSFGVVLLELLTGLRADDRNRPTRQRILVDWVRPYLENRRKLRTVMDSRLEGEYPPEAAQKLARLAQRCLGYHPEDRPSMEKVAETLERINLLSSNTAGKEGFKARATDKHKAGLVRRNAGADSRTTS